MTAIVGVADGKKVWMGADSQGTSWTDSWDSTQCKVFKSKQFLFGVSGSYRVMQLLEHKLSIEDDPRDDTERFMCVQFVDAYLKLLKDNGCCSTEKGVDTSGSTVMVGFRGRLFTVFGNYSALERREKYDAVGCGYPYALGSLSETGKLKPHERVTKAPKCAETFSAGVGGPFTILSQ